MALRSSAESDTRSFEAMRVRTLRRLAGQAISTEMAPRKMHHEG